MSSVERLRAASDLAVCARVSVCACVDFTFIVTYTQLVRNSNGASQVIRD